MLSIRPLRDRINLARMRRFWSARAALREHEACCKRCCPRVGYWCLAGRMLRDAVTDAWQAPLHGDAP